MTRTLYDALRGVLVGALCKSVRRDQKVRTPCLGEFLHDRRGGYHMTTAEVVREATRWAVDLASSKEPDHPALEDFLEGVEAR